MKNDQLKISGMQNGATPKVFKNAAMLRANMTESELKFWEYLKTKPKNFKFRRQHPITSNEIGIKEIRFTNEEVLGDFEKTIDKIGNYLSEGIPLGIEASPFRGSRGRRKGKTTKL